MPPLRDPTLQNAARKKKRAASIPSELRAGRMTSYESWTCKFESKRRQDLPFKRCRRAGERAFETFWAVPAYLPYRITGNHS
jgi:hypothetical protein